MRLDVPYLKLRDGRPRWEPGPKLRAAGWRGRDLRDADGVWLGVEAAIAAAREINNQVQEWRRTGLKPRRTPPPRTAALRSGTALWHAYAESPKFSRRAPSTRRDYGQKVRVFLETFGDEPVRAITAAQLYKWWEQLYRRRGHAMANAVLAVTRLLLSHAVRLGWRLDNPAKGLGLEGVPPRTVVWAPVEIDALLAAADHLGEEGVGDAVVIALHTGQRQGDVLALEIEATENGRVYVRQSKRGARVSVPHTPQLAERLARIAARRSGMRVLDLATSRRIVLDPQGRPYKSDWFRKRFAAVRAAATRRQSGCAGKTFADLRDTAITRLALAGCTQIEIHAITGHSLASIAGVLRHYLALDPRLADAAVGRLREWMAKEGIGM